LKTVVGIAGMFVSASLLFTAPILIPAGLLLMYPSIKIANNGLNGNYIKNSSFIVAQNKKLNKNKPGKVDIIGQDLFAVSRMIEARKDPERQRFFVIETIKTFEQLKREKNGKPIEYGFTSQAYTLRLIKTMQKLGYVDITFNEKSEKKKKNLILERLAFGVKASKKKRQLYDVAFTLTDKKFDSRAMDEVLNSLPMDFSNYDKSYTKKGHTIYKINKSVAKPLKEETPLDVVKEENNITELNMRKGLKYKLNRVFRSFQRKEPKKVDNIDNRLRELQDLREQILPNEEVETYNRNIS